MSISPLTQAFLKFRKTADASDLTRVIAVLQNFWVILKRKQLISFLLSPTLTLSEKVGILKKMADIFKMDEQTFDLLALLTRKKRLSELPQMIDGLKIFRADRFDLVEGEVIASSEMTEEQLTQAEKLFSKAVGHHVLLKTTINPSILGGVILKTADTVIDASMKTKIKKLRSLVAA